jgi:hemoglobin
MHEIVDRVNINEMVREFYASVLQDELLSPFFIRALGDDLKNGKWHEHLHTLDNFWLLIMIGKKGYGGDPFPPHAFLGPLSPETFERWLKLFKETVSRLYTPEIADKFYSKANILAEQFMENLGMNDDDEDDY